MIPTHISQRPLDSDGPGPPKPPIIQLPDRDFDSMYLQPAQPPTPYRNGNIHLSTCSPVNENGSFLFDRVLKTGRVHRRLKHKHFRPSWKPGYLVLRPNLLSVYKDEEATRLNLSITLSDVTAVALVRPPRSHRQHVFGIFTPSTNYRFQALSHRDAEDWVERIRSETRIDEEDEAFLAFTGTSVKRRAGPIDYISDHSDLDHSDLDQGAAGRRPTPSDQEIGGSPSRRFFCAPGYSSHDDWSDGPFSTAKPRPLSPSVHDISPFRPIERPMHSQCQPKDRTLDFGIPRNPEKVICHGYLQGLRIEGGVRQWKRLWTVLRPKSLAFYKNDQEYSAIKIIPMTQVIDAAEIDPLSRSKNFCFQIIVEEKSYRLCAPDEESFDKWLGCLKSIIVVIRQNSKASNPITPA